MVHKKASIFELVHETWGLAYGIVSFKELAMKSMLLKMFSLYGIQCMLIVNSNHGMTWIGLWGWREQGKGFEGPSVGEGQAMAWAPKDYGCGEEESTCI